MPRLKQAARITRAIERAQRPHYNLQTVIKNGTTVVHMPTGKVYRTHGSSCLRSRSHWYGDIANEGYNAICTITRYGEGPITAFLDDLLVWG